MVTRHISTANGAIATLLLGSTLLLSSTLLFSVYGTATAEQPPLFAANRTASSSLRRAHQPELRISEFRDLQEFAKRVAASEYVPEPPLIPVLANMDYEQYREIQFRHEQGVWNDSKHPFWLEFFHRGFVQKDRVNVFAVDQFSRTGTAKQLHYHPSQFRFGGAAADLSVPASVGYAGIKIAGRFEPEGDPQELLTFLGSSYFRSRTADTVYGTSARGLAVNIGMNQDEEFPDFRSFWVQEPSPSDRVVRVLALMDSPSLTGAYEFSVDPGQNVSQMDVRATLYFRDVPNKVAIAPLTSMWIWGDGLQGPKLDERPSVHDCDGLLIHEGDRWMWRGLARLPYPSVTSTSVNQVHGFGLLQRDRDVEHFRDSNARYHERPSVWVRPNESWGAGRIELLEIPGAHEGIDNIGAYFVSDSPVDANRPLELNYTVFFFSEESALSSAVVPKNESGLPLLTCREFDVQRDDRLIRMRFDFNRTAQRYVDEVSAGVSSVEENVSLAAEPEEERLVSDAENIAASDSKFDPLVRLVRGKLVDRKVVQTGDRVSVEIAFEATEDAPIEIEMTLNDADGIPQSETFRYLCPRGTPNFVYPAVYTRQE
ncbi:glucan biosynthesis protein [Rhodopirellula sallentina]|uniref:Periplasmic glucan biosynthesis protein MdoG n=1 Tax=Rhodopirellula sallentina SM41 TaxID=1263870 RepID=M5TZ24_9BACT|nr:glucan biosynthesis protein [Rhodopirellula sallentina]EMI54264.1 periplasmic glucan biosynthesis protein MdoG [Rhodopirellula sallentina SM41]